MLLVDAYNVLHSPMPAMLAGLDIAGLCRALGQTSWARQGRVVVVADGVPRVLGTTQSPVDSVELVYSGGSSAHGGKTADDVIIAMVQTHRTPRSVTVVSSDRVIRSAARGRRAKSWSSEDFLARLCGQLRREKPQHAARKRGAKEPRRIARGRATRSDSTDGLSPHRVEQWLRLMGLGAGDVVGGPSVEDVPRVAVRRMVG
ncbi:MAG: NYN domain-containing protein, partial [Planctomycetota bacterium]